MLFILWSLVPSFLFSRIHFWVLFDSGSLVKLGSSVDNAGLKILIMSRFYLLNPGVAGVSLQAQKFPPFA